MMFVNSCVFAMPNWFGRGEHGFEVKQAYTTQVGLNRLIRLFYLFLFYSLCGVVQANDIELSGLIQSPSNPLPVGTSANYNFTLRNVEDGINSPSRIAVGISVIVDGVTVPADSGEFEVSGCSYTYGNPSVSTCIELAVGGSQTLTFTWLNPTPGNHSVTFRASCEIVPVGAAPDQCASSGASLSTTTMVGLNPTAVLNPGGPTVTIEDTVPSLEFDGLSSTTQDGTVASCDFRMDGGQFVNAPNCRVEYNTPSPGDHALELQVTDRYGLTDITSLNLRVLSYPEAESGGDQQLTDTDNDGVETVTLDASNSSDVGGAIVSYEWFMFDVSGAPVATGVTANLALAVGTHNVTLRVTDNDGMVTEDPFTVTILAGPAAPIANAGVDQLLTDSDNNSTELVQLDGTASMASDGMIASYQWLEFDAEIAIGATPSVTLAVGTHTLTLRVTGYDGAVGEDQVEIQIEPAPNAPIADAGDDITLTDRDNDGSELVTIDASGSSDNDGTIVSYQWFENGIEIANTSNATVNLAVGVHSLTLRVVDNDDLVSEDQLTVSVAAVQDVSTPIADAGSDQSVVDADGDGIESVTLDGTASTDSDGTIIRYIWLEGDLEIANGATAEVDLPIGTHTLTLLVTDDTQLTNQDQVVISVSSAEAQLQIVTGSHLSGGTGETVGPFTVRLIDPSGAPIVGQSIAWRVIPGNAANLSETESTTDGQGQATTSMTIEQAGVIKLVASYNGSSIEFLINSIAERPGLTDNQVAVGSSMDNLCLVLAEQQVTGELSEAEQDLLTTCSNLVVESGVADSLTRLAPEEVAAQGTASIEAANTQLTNLNNRLVALRSGDTGMNLAGLTVNYAGISFNQRLFEGLYPVADKRRGGSAGDLDELQGRWGGFVNGSINFGEKDQTDREAGFEFDTSGITLGLDYRFNPQFVAGSALGFSRYDSDYSDAAGRLEMDAWNLSAYATYYHDNNIFVDGLFQYGSNSYDTERRINPIGGADQFGRGDTEGMEYSLNLSAGYEYRQHAVTLTPYTRFSYTRVEIDGYTEQASNQSAAGFGSVLHIEDQVVKSTLLLFGGSFSYSYSTRHGVLMPQLRFEWEHEFEDDTRYINAGFAHDPTRSTFAIETDEVDTDYFNLGVGLTAVVAEGKSGYLFYETRIAQDNVSLNRINAGIRIEF